MSKNHKESYYAFKPIEGNSIILDFSKHQSLKGIHELLKDKFGLPEYYGETPDALWDCLDGRFYGLGNITVQIHGFNSLEKELREQVEILLRVFDDVHKSTPNVIFNILS